MFDLQDASVEACLLAVVFWWHQGIVSGSKIWYLDLFVVVMTSPLLLEMMLTMKWYEMVIISIGFSCLWFKSYGSMAILSFSMISIIFSNDLFYVTMSMSECDKFLFLLCVLNITDGFDCTYICTTFTTFIS